MTTDGELLRRYTESASEEAFGELVRRHLDLVYSAALRQVNGDAHLAQDVSQSVFTDLARKAAGLTDRAALAGWLYTSVHHAAANAVRTQQRRQTREQEAHIMQELLHDSGPDAEWEAIRAVLDAAMLELSETDREAILLRYFQNRRHADIGEQLGLGENAARMRVDRALEKLRAVFARRGVTATAALSTVIAAHAVIAAPVGLSAIITSTAAGAGIAGATIAGTTTKAIAMTTLQKTLLAATIAAALGTGVFEARQASQLREQNRALQQQQESFAGKLQELEAARNDATNRLAAVAADNEQLRSAQKMAEVLKLRGEVGTLRRSLSDASTASPPAAGHRKNR